MTRPAARAALDRMLREAARRLDRRHFLTLTSAAAALAFSVDLPDHEGLVDLPPRSLTENPFTLGVASGDPLPDAVVLWTRLAPRPLEPGQGMPPVGTVRVGWEVAHDEHFTRLQRRGTARAWAAFNHTVHVDVTGLEPGRGYYYRFTVGQWTSPVGRTRTAPAPGDDPDLLRLGLVSCQNYSDGYYTALRHLAADDLDAVLHVGDYIYEHGVNSQGGRRRYTDHRIPARFDRELATLEDYRLRHALYKTDPDLQAAHAAHPWYVTWDDHDVENDYAGSHSANGRGTADFLALRAAAYRAYWENQPLRLPQPTGPDLTLYRRVQYGQLAQLDILDTRQYRDRQANHDWPGPPGRESADPRRTLMGATQERWFADGLRTSTARWNLVPQQVVFSRCAFTATVPPVCSVDAWDGYSAARDRFLDAVEQAGTRNLVVLTGDAHVAHAFDIKRDFDHPASRTLGVEFVGTSVSSEGDGTARPANWATLTAANPHMKFYDARRGWTRITVSHDTVRADYLALDRVSRPDGTVSTAGSFVTVADEPGLHPA